MPTQSKPAAATSISSAMQRYAAIPLRAIAGGGFVQHGWAKIIKGPEAFAAILQSLHVPLPHLAAYLTISVELLAGAAFLFGAFILWASVPGDCGPADCHVYGPSPLWLQFHQNQSDRGWSGAIRTSWVRMRPSLYRVHPDSRAPQSSPVVHR